MGPIEFPEKYENVMRLAQQALAEQDYRKAETLFKRAFTLSPGFECNSLLVFCLFELDEKKEALQRAMDYESDYLQQEAFASFYFDLLLQTQNYLYARKLIAMNDFPEAFEQELLEKIKHMEYFSEQMERQKHTDAQQQLEHFTEESPAEQLRLLQVIQQLTYEDLLHRARQYMTTASVHPMVRAKLLELLVQLKTDEPVSFLTIENEKVSLIPKNLLLPEYQPGYLELLRLAEDYEQEDSLLAMSLKEEFAMQSALVYPFFDRFIEEPEWWFQKTVSYYKELIAGKESAGLDQGFSKKREELLRQTLGFF
ncbi:hypothetical protein D920_01977 [Enterococcus faecalis 13-SD-W-01]|nr:hypothetical protein D920_01977 [Enterococcus faecalis 13-SD-W-01]